MSDAPTVADRILGMLAAHTSKQPARDADLLARVGGDETEFWTAIEALKASRQINVAHIKRASDPAAWLAIWPTGARVGMEKLFGRKVFLETWCKVREGWSDDEAALRRFGYSD